MNKMFVAALAAVGASFCFNAVADDVLFGGDSEQGRLSVHAGYFSPLGCNDELDLDGIAGEVELIVRPFNNFALGFRGTFGVADDEEDISLNAYGYRWPVGSVKMTYTDINLATQAYLSFFRNEYFDIYVTGGIYYDYIEAELEYSSPYFHDFDESDDGDTFGFLGGVGLELRNEYVGIKLEADYLSKCKYDEDELEKSEEKAQIQAFGSLMFFVGDNVALDLSGRYFTEWEDLYAMCGLTVIF